MTQVEKIEAASTKWNFNKYQPGLVIGHCIGVTPIIYVHKSKSHGFTPWKLLSNARKVNEKMPEKFVKF